MSVKFKHCGRLDCIESGGPHPPDRCFCTCDDCRTCICGCNDRFGFVQDGGTGEWWGMGAGYKLERTRAGWDVFDPDGRSIYKPDGKPGQYERADAAAIPQTMDGANLAATAHARAAGHGHA